MTTKDPYKILGVSESATDDEIKKAYRSLTKKYHPDLHPDDPHASEKMNEINTAYDQIKNAAARSAYAQQSAGAAYGAGSYGGAGYGSGNGGSAYGYNPFTGGFGGAYGSQQQSYGWNNYQQHTYTGSQANERSEVQAARNYIRNGMYTEALNALAGVPVSERDGRWYYLNAAANMYKGNKVAAMESAKRAVAYEPDNEQYRELLEQLEMGGDFYNNYSTSYKQQSVSMDKLCLGMICANMFLGPMCGYRFFCC